VLKIRSGVGSTMMCLE